MSTQMQLRGGTTAENLLFTGAQREVTVDTDKNTLVVQDGITAGGFPLATEATLADGTYLYIDDTGGGSVANAYILIPQTNTNVPNSYRNGVIFSFVTTNPNTGPSTASFQGLGAKSIKYPGGLDPAAGDVSGRVTLIYDLANDWLELQRKATGSPPQIRTVGASVNANTMTVTLSPCTIDFRSTVGSSGAVTSVNVVSTLSLTIPSGATLGTVNGVASSIAIVAINNAGTVELAVVNTSGSGQLDESSIVNTVAISAASLSATVFYSLVARAGVAYRVVGFVESTQASAGVWASPPSKVQGQGGQTIIGLRSVRAQASAWVNFNGTGVVAIRDSYNVSSITDNGTGDYTVNFATPLANANYAISLTTRSQGGPGITAVTIEENNTTAPTASAFRIVTKQSAAGIDSVAVYALVFGG